MCVFAQVCVDDVDLDAELDKKLGFVQRFQPAQKKFGGIFAGLLAVDGSAVYCMHVLILVQRRNFGLVLARLLHEGRNSLRTHTFSICRQSARYTLQSHSKKGSHHNLVQLDSVLLYSAMMLRIPPSLGMDISTHHYDSLLCVRLHPPLPVCSKTMPLLLAKEGFPDQATTT